MFLFILEKYEALKADGGKRKKVAKGSAQAKSDEIINIDNDDNKSDDELVTSDEVKSDEEN